MNDLRRLSLLAALLLVAACRRTTPDDGPLRDGDTSLAVEPIQSIIDPDDGEPPPPPIDTISDLRLSGASAELTDLRVRVRYYLDDKGTQGWVDFPKDNQPPGVQIDSAARIIIHGSRIGGAGTIQVRGAAGIVDIDLGQVGGEGTVISGRCRKDQPQGGACATLTFKSVRFTPAGGGQPTTHGATLDVGVPVQRRGQ